MSGERYDLVFKGELVKTVALDQAKQNISRLFKVTGPKLDALFSGKPVILKRNIDFETASKYRVAIKKAGARVDLVESKAATPQPAQDSAKAAGLTAKSVSKPVSENLRTPAGDVPPSPGRAVFGSQDLSGSSDFSSQAVSSAPKMTQSNKPAVAQKKQEKITVNGVEGAVASQVTHPVSQDMSVAPVGEDLTVEKEEPELPLIDVSMISVQEMNGNLIHDNERRAVEKVNVDTSALSLAEAGGDLLAPGEKHKYKDLQLDLSAYSVAELGENLDNSRTRQLERERHLAPDVSDIQLQ